jgi:pseudaminic acid synthase
MSICINRRIINFDQPPYIIAELSANHNGSLERALKLVSVAHELGADAIKLQTYTADSMTIDCDREEFIVKGGLWGGMKLYDLYKWAETPLDWHETIFSYARQLGITVFSTPFDESAVDFLESLGAPAYKIASFENTDLPLIRRVAKTGKPLIMSTGMASEEEIAEAVDTARGAGCTELVLLHCISSYPAPIEQANLRQIPELARRFDVLVGLSDHTMGVAASIAAVALGACVIEKHFTLDRSHEGADSKFSIEPDELKRLCDEARDGWRALGKACFERQTAEEGSRVFRRSIFFVRDLPAGAVISSGDIRRIRPGMGLRPKHFDQLLGKKLKVAVKRGMPTSWDMFEN